MKIPLTPGPAVTIHGLAVRQWLTRGDVLANDKLGRRSIVSTTQQRLIQLGSQDLAPDLKACHIETEKVLCMVPTHSLTNTLSNSLCLSL